MKQRTKSKYFFFHVDSNGHKLPYVYFFGKKQTVVQKFAKRAKRVSVPYVLKLLT